MLGAVPSGFSLCRQGRGGPVRVDVPEAMWQSWGNPSNGGVVSLYLGILTAEVFGDRLGFA